MQVERFVDRLRTIELLFNQKFFLEKVSRTACKALILCHVQVVREVLHRLSKLKIFDAKEAL